MLVGSRRKTGSRPRRAGGAASALARGTALVQIPSRCLSESADSGAERRASTRCLTGTTPTHDKHFVVRLPRRTLAAIHLRSTWLGNAGHRATRRADWRACSARRRPLRPNQRRSPDSSGCIPDRAGTAQGAGARGAAEVSIIRCGSSQNRGRRDHQKAPDHCTGIGVCITPCANMHSPISMGGRCRRSKWTTLINTPS